MVGCQRGSPTRTAVTTPGVRYRLGSPGGTGSLHSRSWSHSDRGRPQAVPRRTDHACWPGVSVSYLFRARIPGWSSARRVHPLARKDHSPRRPVSFVDQPCQMIEGTFGKTHHRACRPERREAPDALLPQDVVKSLSRRNRPYPVWHHVCEFQAGRPPAEVDQILRLGGSRGVERAGREDTHLVSPSAADARRARVCRRSCSRSVVFLAPPTLITGITGSSATSPGGAGEFARSEQYPGGVPSRDRPGKHYLSGYSGRSAGTCRSAARPPSRS